MWAWGFGLDGELGNGTAASSPVPVQVTGLAHVTGISAGSAAAALATRTNGITVLTSVWAWGGNDSGQLGDGTFTSHLTPKRVTGIGTSYIASIAAGSASPPSWAPMARSGPGAPTTPASWAARRPVTR